MTSVCSRGRLEAKTDEREAETVLREPLGESRAAAEIETAAPDDGSSQPEKASLHPIPASPLDVLESDPRAFRGKGYDVFSWADRPGILILRFADYATQDRWLKRLAFFVEKAGFRGRLARDEEIAGLHGWNAHDYRARDLARFFSQALEEGFPLNREEEELRALLLAQGHILAEGGAFRGEPDRAIVSVSAESAPAMERRFIVHELYHALYFTVPAFARDAAALRAGMEADLRAYVEEFMDYKDFDIGDQDLMDNEFMAYFLQLDEAGTLDYFGRSVAEFLEQDRGGDGSWLKRGQALGPAIRRAAEEYSDLAYRHFGYRSGRVWR
jgi:hypothetical protein